MRVYKLNKNNKVTIPSGLRKSFGIEKGAKVYFVEEKDGIKIFPITTKIVDENFEIRRTKERLIHANRKKIKDK